MSEKRIKKRLVLNFPGFEKTGTEHQIARLLHGAGESGKFWGYKLHQEGDIELYEKSHAVSSFRTEGGNWNTETRLVQFSWNDIVDTYEDAPFPKGFFQNLPKFFAFFGDGTVGRYFRSGKRYWGFTIFPILLVGIFGIVGWFLSGFALLLAGISSSILQLIFMLVLTLVFCRWPGQRLYLIMTIADWGFARDMVNQTNPKIEKRFEHFAEIAGAEIAGSNADEIIVVGHSFGAIWAIAALSKALDGKDGLLAGKKLTFLSLGSSILKIAFSPRAQFIRDHWDRVMQEESLFWHEIQTKDDFIAFYKCDPFSELDMIDMAASYEIDRIRFKDGMDKKRYKKMRRSFFRTHRQYILNYDKRVGFDYMMRIFGPLNSVEWAKNDKLHKVIDAEGRLS